MSWSPCASRWRATGRSSPPPIRPKRPMPAPWSSPCRFPATANRFWSTASPWTGGDSRMGFVSRQLESFNNRVFRRIGRQEVREAVAGLGIGPGDVVYAHVSIKRLGYVMGGAPEVAEALREVLGATGTLVLCAWSAPDARPDGTELFDVMATPARTGLLAETVRLMPGAVRSLHPVASVVAIGARAAEITEGHERCPTPFGSGTPYARLAAMRPKLLLVGAHVGGLLYHLQERVDFPNLFDPSVREFEVRDAGGHHRKVRSPVLSAIPPA